MLQVCQRGKLYKQLWFYPEMVFWINQTTIILALQRHANEYLLKRRCSVLSRVLIWDVYLKFLSATLCLELRPSCFLPVDVCNFPVPMTFTKRLDALAGGLVCWTECSVSGVTVKTDLSGDNGDVGIFPMMEARMVTWKKSTTVMLLNLICIHLWIVTKLNSKLNGVLRWGQTLVPGGRPSKALGFLKVLWRWVLCSNFSL